METIVRITPWIDPVVDRRGHDPRSSYVEQFWLGTLGPTATWLVRRLVAGSTAIPPATTSTSPSPPRRSA